MDVLKIMGEAQNIIGALIIICGGVMTIALIIPGEQPEKFFKSCVDFLSKFSKK